jgi:hypothetical protein
MSKLQKEKVKRGRKDMNRFISTTAMAATLLVGCAGQQQAPNVTLYEVKIPTDVPSSPENSFTNSLEVGPEGRRVPIQITWSAQSDSTGCLKISQVKVSRQGGDPNTVISAVKHFTIPDCGMKFESEDITRYQVVVVQLHYEARKLIKTYTFDGGVASILGNGEFNPM